MSAFMKEHSDEQTKGKTTLAQTKSNDKLKTEPTEPSGQEVSSSTNSVNEEVASGDQTTLSAIPIQHQAQARRFDAAYEYADVDKFRNSGQQRIRAKRSTVAQFVDDDKLQTGDKTKSCNNQAESDQSTIWNKHSIENEPKNNERAPGGEMLTDKRQFLAFKSTISGEKIITKSTIDSIDGAANIVAATTNAPLPRQTATGQLGESPLNNSAKTNLHKEEEKGRGRRKSSGEDSFVGMKFASLDVGSSVSLDSIDHTRNDTTTTTSNLKQPSQHLSLDFRLEGKFEVDSEASNYANKVNSMHRSNGSSVGKLSGPTQRGIIMVSSESSGAHDGDGPLEQATISSNNIIRRNRTILEKSSPADDEASEPIETIKQSNKLIESNPINGVSEPSLGLFYHNNLSAKPLIRQLNTHKIQAINKTDALELNNHLGKVPSGGSDGGVNREGSLDTWPPHSHRNNTTNLKHLQRQQQPGLVGPVGAAQKKGTRDVPVRDELTSDGNDIVGDDNHPIDSVIVPSISSLNPIDPLTGAPKESQHRRRHKRSPSVIDDLQDISSFSSRGGGGGGAANAAAAAVNTAGENTATISRVIDGARNWNQLERRHSTPALGLEQQKHGRKESRREEKSEIVSTFPSESANNLIDDDDEWAAQIGPAEAIQSISGRTNRHEISNESGEEGIDKTKSTLANSQWSQRNRSKVEQSFRLRGLRGNTRRGVEAESGHDPSHEHKLRRRRPLKTRYRGRQDLVAQNGDKSAANIEADAGDASIAPTRRLSGDLTSGSDSNRMNENELDLDYAHSSDNGAIDNRRAFANGQYLSPHVESQENNNEQDNNSFDLNGTAKLRRATAAAEQSVVVEEIDVDKMIKEVEQHTLPADSTTVTRDSNSDGNIIDPPSVSPPLPLLPPLSDDDETLLWSAGQYLYLHMRAFAALSLYGIQVDVEWSNERVNDTNIDLADAKMDAEELISLTSRQRKDYESKHSHWHDSAPFATIDLVPGQNLHLECTAQALGRLPEVKWFKRIKSIPAHLDQRMVSNLVRHINHEPYWPLTQLDLLVDGASPAADKEKRFVCSQSITIFDNLVNQTFAVVNSLQLSQYNDFTDAPSGNQMNLHPTAGEEQPSLRASSGDNLNLYACIVDADVRHNYATLGVNFRTRMPAGSRSFVDQAKSASLLMDSMAKLNTKQIQRQQLEKVIDNKYDDSTRFNLLRENHISFPMNEFWVPIKNGSYLEENSDLLQTSNDFASYPVTPAILSTAMANFNRMEDDELIIELMKQNDESSADEQQSLAKHNIGVETRSPLMELAHECNQLKSRPNLHPFNCLCGSFKTNGNHYSGQHPVSNLTDNDNSGTNFCSFHHHHQRQQTLIASSVVGAEDVASLDLMDNHHHHCHNVPLDQEGKDCNRNTEMYDAYLDLIEPSSSCHEHLALQLALPSTNTLVPHLHPSMINNGDNELAYLPTRLTKSTDDCREEKLQSCCDDEVNNDNSLLSTTTTKTTTINMVENPLNANYSFGTTK